MDNLKKNKSARKSPDSSEAIQAQTTAFLNSGHKIQVIPSGVSGQEKYTGKSTKAEKPAAP